MADQPITSLPIKTSSGMAATDYLLGIDSAEGYQMLIQDLGDYIIQHATSSLAGQNQTLANVISGLNSNKANKSATVSTVTYDTTNKKLTKTINGTASDIVSASTLKTDMALNNVGNFKAVSTVASQGLSSTEKSNARANIGAGTSSLALGATSSTAYRGDYGNSAYAHAVTNKGSAFSSGLYKITTNSEGHVTAATAVAKADITGLGIPGSDTNTHRPIQVNGTEVLGNNTTALNLKAGSNVSVTNSSGTVTIAATDTTYSAATTSAAGLMSAADKTKLDGIGTVSFGTCNTAAATAAKAVTLTNTNWQLKVGSIIGVDFTYTNTASASSSNPVTLNVANTGAKTILYNHTITAGAMPEAYGLSAHIIYYMYNGTYWVWMGIDRLQDISGKADKSATVSTVAWDSTNKKLTKTINGSTTDVVTGATILGGMTKAQVTTALGYTPPTSDTNTHRPIQVNGTEVLGNNTSALNLKAGSNVSVTNSSGTVTIAATDTNTHRPIQVNGTEVLGNNTTALNLKAGSNVTVTNSSGTVTIAATDTTYSSKAAASGGNDVSLVTTGEKATWNAKTSNVGTITGIKMNGASKGTSGVVDLGTVLTAHQDISGKADKSATVSTVAWDSTNRKLTKTINGTTTDIVTCSTLYNAFDCRMVLAKLTSVAIANTALTTLNIQSYKPSGYNLYAVQVLVGTASGGYYPLPWMDDNTSAGLMVRSFNDNRVVLRNNGTGWGTCTVWLTLTYFKA